MRGGKTLFVIDLQMSYVIKGLACLLILLGHYANMRISPNFSVISKIVWMFSSNVALTWFMFFSGYGLSLKKSLNVKDSWKHSFLKIYLPSLFVGSVAFLMYMSLPVTLTYSDIVSLHINENLYFLQHFSFNVLWRILKSLLLGNGSWYVICIIVFYSVFYLGLYISKYKKKNLSIIIGILFFLYFVFAYLYFGKLQAHYYRYCWTFLFGHAVAVRTKQSWSVAILSLITIIPENWILHVSYILAVVGLYLFSAINEFYEIKGGLLLRLGFMSYFFYLSHESIGYVLLTYLNINSIIVWIFLTILVSYCMYSVWKKVLTR